MAHHSEPGEEQCENTQKEDDFADVLKADMQTVLPSSFPPTAKETGCVLLCKAPWPQLSQGFELLVQSPASWEDQVFNFSLTSTLTVQLMRFSLFSSCMMVL